MRAPAPKVIEWWKPYPLAVFSDPSARSRAQLIAVIDQFYLETNPWFQPGPLKKDGTRDTTCNLFLWAFTRAMGKEVPHWVKPGTKDPSNVGPPNLELNANGTCRWLMEHGARFDWRLCTEAAARGGAELGHPVVAAWWNHSGIGHVAAVRPSPAPGLTYIAQAGKRCFSNEPLSHGFGNICPLFYAAT